MTPSDPSATLAEPCVRCKAIPEISEPQDAVAEVRGELLCFYHMREALKEGPDA